MSTDERIGHWFVLLVCAAVCLAIGCGWLS